jgi:DNA-binding response OmpR family regulator
LIEDEVQMRRFLRLSQASNGYRLVESDSARDGLEQAAARTPELILLDLGLPDQDGLTVARGVRQWSSVPIIVISARGSEDQKIETLDAGADDFLTKPFGVGELLARIRVALRHAARAGSVPSMRFAAGDLEVDLARRRVHDVGWLHIAMDQAERVGVSESTRELHFALEVGQIPLAHTLLRQELETLPDDAMLRLNRALVLWLGLTSETRPVYAGGEVPRVWGSRR